MNIPVFLSADDNYAPFVATTIASICDNTESFVDFYILDGGISEENQEKICELKKIFSNFSIEFIQINPEKEFSSINYSNVDYISISTYNRFLIPKLKPELGKVLYLDVEIVVLGNIEELYNVDLENYALGAAWDESRVLYNTDTKDLMDLSDNYKYFNAGILLIDIQKWNNDKIVERLFEIEKEYGKNVLHADETLLNKYFDSNYKIFDIEFNYTDYDVFNSPNKKPKIRHFASAIKPWNANFLLRNKVLMPLPNYIDFWKYAKMTAFYEKIHETYKKEIGSSFIKQRMNKLVEKTLKRSCINE